MRQNHSNAFDVLRLVLAVLVVYTHAHLLGGFGDEGFSRLVRHQTSAGSFAVLGFFGISGFLVTRSFITQETWKLFVKARLLRIIPGLLLALILTGFFFAPIISYLNASSGGWHAADATRFVVRNAFVKVHEWHVGNVLSGLPYEGSINGSLWSLFPELLCYGVVLVFGLAGTLRLARANLVLFLFVVLVCHITLVLAPSRDNLVPTILSLTKWAPYITAFLVGAAGYLYKDELNLGGRQALLWWMVVAALLKFGGWSLFAPLVLPLALIHAAYSCRISLPADLSYGIYVLHFPILHLVSASGLNRHGFPLYFFIGITLTALFACLSWFLVEKPALNLKTKGTPRMPPPDLGLLRS
ncbi:MAG: acyltransferase family protein [Rariglobus sp.]